MGAFDDLVPAPQAQATGVFDDLVPQAQPSSPAYRARMTQPLLDPGQYNQLLGKLAPGYKVPDRSNESMGDQSLGPVGEGTLATLTSLMGRPDEADMPHGVGRALAEQITPQNAALAGLLGPVVGTEAAAGTLGHFAKAAVTAYFAKQGLQAAASEGGQYAGDVAGSPLEQRTQVALGPEGRERITDIALSGAMALPALDLGKPGPGEYGYMPKQSAPTAAPSSTGATPQNDIVLDIDSPVPPGGGTTESAPAQGAQGDQGVTGAIRLSPGQPNAPGAFDDLVPASTIPSTKPALSETPDDLAAIGKQLGLVTKTAPPEAVGFGGTTSFTDPETGDTVEGFKPGATAEEVKSRMAEKRQPKGNLMDEEAAGLRHDLLPLVDKATQDKIGKYYTDTGDLEGAMKQAHEAWQKQVGKKTETPVLDKAVYPVSKVADRGNGLGAGLVDAKGRPIDAEHNMIKGDVPDKDTTSEGSIGGGIREALAKNGGSEAGFIDLEPIKDLYDKLVGSIASRVPKRDILRYKDAADTAATTVSNQAGNDLRSMARGLFGGQYHNTAARKVRFTAASDMALDAATAAVEANGDRNKILHFIQQAANHPVAKAIAEFAFINWDRLKPLVDRINQIHEVQYQREIAAGFNLDKREGYIQHLIDPDKLGLGVDMFGSKGSGGARGFTKMRYNETLFDHVEKGNGDAIRTWNAADLVENRLKAGLQGVNDAAWVEGMRSLVDPTTGRPVVTSMVKQVNPATKSEHLVAPPGYEAWSPFPGRSFAVHKGYKGFLDSVTSASVLRNWELAGLPVGKAMMKTAGGIKHSLLLFDTFHAVRMTVKGLSFGVTGRHAQALLEYSNQGLQQAVSNGEITQEMADYARSKRSDFNALVRNGLNVGRVAEALDADVWQKIPLAGTFNRWVFQKLTRSVMTEAALKELDKQQAANPGMSREAVAKKVAKDMNMYFGNIGRQGIFHSRSMQDATRLAFLAPQWFESMAQTELRFAGQTTKIPFTGKVGSIARGTGTLLAASFIITQIGNMLSKGKPTWDNEDGHKMDMWIPSVGKGKGFWFSPLAVPLEITHDVVRYMNEGKQPLEVASKIISNKFAPGLRAEEALRTGRDYSDAQLRGWARVNNAARDLIPMPLPAQSALNPNTSVQRQLMASAGLKAEPVAATKAELAAGDTPLESMSLSQRRGLQQGLPKAGSLSERRTMLERSAQAEASRNEVVYDSIPKEQRKFLDDHNLQLPTYEDTLQAGKTRLSLTKKEQDFVKDKVVEQYSKVLDGLMSNPSFVADNQKQQQQRINTLMTQARGRVRIALRHEMAEQRILLSQ